MNGNGPLHPVEIRISIGGNSWEYVFEALDEIKSRLEHCRGDAGVASGGYMGAHSVTVATRDVTPEQYHAELAEYLNSHKLQRIGHEIPLTPAHITPEVCFQLLSVASDSDETK